MKCDYCKIQMEKRRATEEHPYNYKRSGLDNLLLSGIDVYRCSKCSLESPVIPKVAQLYNVLADDITRKPQLLRGDEIRFLRKHAGLPAQTFARLLGVSAEHLSRIENGHTKGFGKNTDRLIRAFTLTAKEGQDARRTLLEIADALANRRVKPSKVLDIFCALKPRTGWHLSKRAA